MGGVEVRFETWRSTAYGGRFPKHTLRAIFETIAKIKALFPSADSFCQAQDFGQSRHIASG
jgi:hypothetical protein